LAEADKTVTKQGRIAMRGGYGYRHGGVGLFGTILIIVVIPMLMGRI
jgi:hypothetical protein